MKICRVCGENKPFTEYTKAPSNDDNHKGICKPCDTIEKRDYYRTKKGVVNKIYWHQKHHSKLRNHALPNYTKKELYNALIENKVFNIIYDKWVESGYEPDLKPSVDRKDDYIGYTKANIQIMTWSENRTKSHNDRKNGINNKVSVPVKQYSMENKLLNTFHSIREAARKTGTNATTISYCCRGTYKQAGGYIWRKNND